MPHQYTIRAPQRDALAAHLKERGIGTMVYYPAPLHLQGLYANLGYGEDSPSTTLHFGQALGTTSQGRSAQYKRQGSGDVLRSPLSMTKGLSKGQGPWSFGPGTKGSGRRLPVSEGASQEVLSLPMYPELTGAQQVVVTEAILGFYE